MSTSAVNTCGNCIYYSRRMKGFGDHPMGCTEEVCMIQGEAFLVSAVSPACAYFGRRPEA